MTEGGKLTRLIGMRTEYNSARSRYELVEYRKPKLDEKPARAIHGWLDVLAAEAATRTPGGLEKALEILWREVVGEHVENPSVREILCSCRHEYDEASATAHERVRS